MKCYVNATLTVGELVRGRDGFPSQLDASELIYSPRGTSAPRAVY